MSLKLQVELQWHDTKAGKYRAVRLESDCEGYRLEKGHLIRVYISARSTFFLVRIKEVLRGATDDGVPGPLRLDYAPILLVEPGIPGATDGMSLWPEIMLGAFVFHGLR